MGAICVAREHVHRIERRVSPQIWEIQEPVAGLRRMVG